MSGQRRMQADVVVVGAGLAGLVAACEVAARGKRVLVLDQEGEQNLGVQRVAVRFVNHACGSCLLSLPARHGRGLLLGFMERCDG